MPPAVQILPLSIVTSGNFRARFPIYVDLTLTTSKILLLNQIKVAQISYERFE